MVRAFMPHLRPYRRKLAFVVLLGGLGSAVQALTPFVSKYIIDDILARRDLPLFYLFIGVCAGALLVIQGLRLLQSYLSLYPVLVGEVAASSGLLPSPEFSAAIGDPGETSGRTHFQHDVGP